MKSLFILLAVITLLSGCAPFAENNKRVAQLNQQMSSEWLKSHIIVGKTTPSDVAAWFGNPVVKTASSGAGFGSAFMPDEIWTYSVHFTQADSTLTGSSSAHWTKSIAFSFKNGTVMDYQINQVAF